MLSSILDTVLDRSIVGGYTKVGYAVRSRGWITGDLRPMDGRVVVVTGATGGLGLAAAEGFARLGATVCLVARDAERGEQARAQVARHSAAGDTELALCDLALLASVRELAAGLAALHPRIDVLVNNAGVLSQHRTVTGEGIELAFAVNVLAPFLLTQALLEPLRAAAPSRVINVSSGGMYARKLNVDDLQSEHGDYDGTVVYARTKRAEVILTEMWAQRLAGSGVVVHAMHPGWADTPGISASLPRFHRITGPLLRSPEQGADTIVWLGAADEPLRSSGGFWHDRRRRPTHLVRATRETEADRLALWSECERLCGPAGR
jgi:NAD(P)-dependent dehydrogenase (short-subunit alcohol dehydrogenase family)